MSKMPLWVNRVTHDRVKTRAAERGVTMGAYIERRMHVATAEEPLGHEGVAILVGMIVQKTGETREACLLRLMSRAAMEDFAELCAS